MTRRQDETDKFMETLLNWCQAEVGRAREIASELGVAEQVVSNWLHRRKTPRLTNWHALRRFADKRGIK